MTQEQNRIKELEDLVKILLAEILDLKLKLSKYETPKNSNNSSIPPSKDENRPRHTQSLREKTDRKTGGQIGHTGTTLEMIDTPDELIKHYPHTQCSCGESLKDYPVRLTECRQVLDLPVIKPIISEHQVFEQVCKCGRHHIGQFPNGVTSGISYGTGVESLAGYLHARQFLPLDRMREFFNDILSVPISEGGLYNAIDRIAKKAQPSYENIRQEVEKSLVVGTDETGSRIDGHKGWFWTWQTSATTFIAASMDRGTKTIDRLFANGFPDAVFVHDCWKSHFNPIVLNHQICIAHLLRELKYLTQQYNDNWSDELKILLLDALELKKTMTNTTESQMQIVRNILNRRLNSLLEKEITDDKKELIVFQKRLIRYKDYLFVFLDNINVPPDNNGSERAIRNIKVKHKISGYFKSMRGADIFAILRSVTDTALKKNQNIFATLQKIALT
ncbi:MAG: IS66 family transposase [Deltaproteobacteria bacterium]